MNWNKENTVFIQATTGFLYEGSIAEGFQAYHPYKGSGLFLRLLREFCFRTGLLRRAWYIKDFLKIKDLKYFVVWDPLITRDYLEWLHKCRPEAEIIFKYTNMVGTARHLHPDRIPGWAEKWTYDGYDSEKYGIRLQKTYVYFPEFVKPLREPEYDIFFVGKDKGRGDRLKEFEKELSCAGIRTRFIIAKDGRFSVKKSYYEKEIPYSAVTDYLAGSRAVLNVTMENQTGLTLRDMESLFFGIKLITTNGNIRNSELYHPQNVFILKDFRTEGIADFLEQPVVRAGADVLKGHTLSDLMDEITAQMENNKWSR